MTLNTLGNPERLKSRKSIEKLFSSGRYYSDLPLVARFHIIESDQRLRIAVVVPKKKFKRAVDRNLLKRRMREAYRLNSHDFISFLQSKNVCLEMIFIYHSGQISESQVITESVKGIFSQIEKTLSKS